MFWENLFRSFFLVFYNCFYCLFEKLFILLFSSTLCISRKYCNHENFRFLVFNEFWDVQSMISLYLQNVCLCVTQILWSRQRKNSLTKLHKILYLVASEHKQITDQILAHIAKEFPLLLEIFHFFNTAVQRKIA